MTEGTSGGTSSQQSSRGSEEVRRRSGDPAGEFDVDRRSPETSVTSSEWAALVEKTLEEWRRRHPGSVEGRALDKSGELLARVLREAPGTPVRESVREPASMLHVRAELLDLTRRFFVEFMRQRGTVPDGRTLLSRMTRFEEVRSALEPAWDQQIEAAFSGPRANAMLAEIGHDLRSPLTSVMFLSEVLRDSPGLKEDPQKNRQLGLIYTGALTMLNIVNNFMEVVKRGGTEAEGESSIFSLEELLNSVRRTIQPMADEKGLLLETRLKVDRRDRRSGYPVALSRILLNLTTNSLKFTESGRVEVTITEPAPGLLEFSVSDTGPGIDAETEASIFQVFEPAQDRHGVHFSATGLGLVIVRRLLRELGSELACESTPGEGTRMSFRIRMDLPPG